jgi:hypothetical protein
MVTTKFISNCTVQNLDELKIGILYFDKIEIVNNVLYQVKPVPNEKQNKEKNIGVITGVTEFVTDGYKEKIDLLVEEGVVELISGEGKSEDRLWDSIDKITNEILSKETSIIFNESDVEFDSKGRKKRAKVALSKEAKQIHEEFIGPLGINRTLDLGFLY